MTHQRASQLPADTFDSIRRQIESDYPQLAEGGVNGWAEFQRAFDHLRPIRRTDRPYGCRH